MLIEHIESTVQNGIRSNININMIEYIWYAFYQALLFSVFNGAFLYHPSTNFYLEDATNLGLDVEFRFFPEGR